MPLTRPVDDGPAARSGMVIGADKPRGRPPEMADRVRQLGAILGWTGLAFLLIGGVDFALTWFPMDFGNREWEFGTVTASLNGLPVPTIGMALLLAGALLAERKWWAAIVAAVGLVMVLWVLGGAVLWGTTIPLALSTVPPEVMTGLRKALLKSAAQMTLYPIVFAFLAWKAVGILRGTLGATER